MNQLQLSILTLCNHIAGVRGWDITTVLDGWCLGIDFTCHDSMQKDCFLLIDEKESEIDLTIIFSNLLDLLHCNTIELQNGSLNCKKLNQ